MNIVALDSSDVGLNYFSGCLMDMDESYEYHLFDNHYEALDYIKNEEVNLVFLNVDMSDISGFVLADIIQKMNIDISIAFISTSVKYAFNAFQANGIGYLLIPYTSMDIRLVIEKAMRLRSINLKNRVFIKTFGGFDIFVDDKPLYFPRKKAKELLALLVDRRGCSMTVSEIAAYLWEDASLCVKVKESLKKANQTLKRVLIQNGVQEILIETHNNKSVNTSHISCDYYQFIDGKKSVRDSYLGDYMPGYNWAEETNARLFFIAEKWKNVNMMH